MCDVNYEQSIEVLEDKIMGDIVLLKVDNVSIKNPSSYDMSYSDVDGGNNYTSETGVYNRDLVRANVASISVSWDRLTLSELSELMQKLTGKVEYTLTYLDFYSGEFKTGNFRSSSAKGKAKKIYSLGNGLYSFSLSFKEN